MHSIAEVGTNIPAFLAKLWKMVEDPVTNDLISWNPSGTSFVIKDENRFARELLPMYYKHNNMASFIRQLNMYGFHKIVSHESGSMNLEVLDEIQFSHPYFVRGHSYLLDNIKRKMTARAPSQVGEKSNPQVLGKVLMDVKQMKGRQENIDSRLTAMKMENGALWRELSVLRQKHMKQQQIVNKLIQFLVTLVHQNHNMFSMKRKYPRMLQQIDAVKTGKHEQGQVDDNASNCTNSPTGPIIHELDAAEVLLEDVVEEAEEDEIDTEPVSPSQVSNYFMNESNDDIEDAVMELPFTVLPPNKSVETIIGMPEDTLIMNSNKSNINSTAKRFYLAKELGKKQPVLIPKYNINIVTNKANSDVVVQKRIYETQQRLIQNQQNMKQDLQHQIQMNQQRIQRNQEQINRTKELKRNQQQILKNQQFLLKNQQQVIKNSQDITNNEEELVKNNQTIATNTVKLQRNQNPKLLDQQQSKRNQQQIVQKKQKTAKSSRKQQFPKGLCQQLPKSPYVEVQESPHVKVQKSPYIEVQKSPALQLQKSPHPQQQLQMIQKQEVIDDIEQGVQADSETISLGNSGSVETILGLVDGPGGDVSEYSEVAVPDYTLPIVVNVPPSDTLQEQQVSSPLVSQDLLIGTPVVISNPELTPTNDAASTPVPSLPSPSSSNMQVACLDEPQVSSPNIMSRSANFSTEMGSHVDAMQSDLESLKELLQSEGISLDANALLGYFNEDPLSYNMTDTVNVPSEDPNRPRENNGNELMAYNPTLLDLTDLMGNEWSLPTSPSEAEAADDSFGEIHTPQFVPNSPSFPLPAKRRKK